MKHFAPVHISGNPIEAEQLADFLTQESIECVLKGPSNPASTLNLVGCDAEWEVCVPNESMAAAKKIVEGFLTESDVEFAPPSGDMEPVKTHEKLPAGKLLPVLRLLLNTYVAIAAVYYMSAWAWRGSVDLKAFFLAVFVFAVWAFLKPSGHTPKAD